MLNALLFLLLDLGLYEDGMTIQQKEELLVIITYAAFKTII